MAPTSFPPVQVKRPHHGANAATTQGSFFLRDNKQTTQRQVHEMPAIAKDLGFHIGVRPRTEQARWRMRCTCAKRGCLCSAPFPELSGKRGDDAKTLFHASKGKEKIQRVRLKSLMDTAEEEEIHFPPTASNTRAKATSPNVPKTPDSTHVEEGKKSPVQPQAPEQAPLKSVVGRRKTDRRSSRTQRLVAKFAAKKRTISPQECLSSIGEDDADSTQEPQQQNEEPEKVTRSSLNLRNSLKALDDLRVDAFGSHRSHAKSHGDGANLGELNRNPQPHSSSGLPGISSDLSAFMHGAFQASASKRRSVDESPNLGSDHAAEAVAENWLSKRGTLGTVAQNLQEHNELLFRMKPKQPLSDRLRRVNIRRNEKIKGIRDQRTREMKKRRYNALPRSEIEAIERAFRHFDKENKGYLDRERITPCLKELGVLGKTLDERAALMHMFECTVEGCTRPPFNWQPGQPCCRACQKNNGDSHEIECDDLHKCVEVDKLEALPIQKNASEQFAMTVFVNELNKEKHVHEDEDVVIPHGNGVSLYDFALTVLPQARHRLLELRSGEMLKQFFQFDDDGSGQLSHEECRELAGKLGIDQRMVDQLCEKQEEVDFEQFQHLIAKGKEKVERMVRARERAIQHQLGINDSLFEDFRNDLASLHQLFELYDVDDSGALSMNEVMCMIKEFGLQPKNAQEKDEIDYVLARNDVNGDGEFNFIEFLELIREIRAYKRGKKQEEYLHNFERYDKDKSGTLSVLEISNLLADLGFIPKSYREQDELAFLIHTADDDASGFINFSEFQVLCQRIDEKLKSMRYEEEVEFAMKLGFSEQHIRDLRWIFDSLDSDGSGKLDTTEVRSALVMLRKNISCEVFNSAFRTLDADGSGELDFQEFMMFMQMMRDSEGLFSEEAQKLSSKAKCLDPRLLKRILEHFHLSKTYVNSLDKEDLVGLFCDFLGVSDGSTDLHEALGISTVGELFELVKTQAEGSQTRRRGDN